MEQIDLYHERGSRSRLKRTESLMHYFNVRLMMVLLPLLSVSSALANETRPPNIVFIVSDDQGYDDMGVTNPEVISPNLDRLCEEGVRLTSFYVAWPACTPSRGRS